MVTRRDRSQTCLYGIITHFENFHSGSGTQFNHSGTHFPRSAHFIFIKRINGFPLNRIICQIIKNQCNEKKIIKYCCRYFNP